MIFPGERAAVIEVLNIAESYGYGNLIAHLQTAWAIKLMRSGISKESAIAATLGRTPYPLESNHLDLPEPYRIKPPSAAKGE